MTNSISLDQAGIQNTLSVQMRNDLYAAYKSAESRAKKGKGAKFICVSLCDLHDPDATGLRPSGVAGRIASVKHALQPTVAEYEVILRLLIQLLFSRFTEFPLCPFAASLTEDERKELVIDEIVKIHDQVASNLVTDYTLVADCLCSNMGNFIYNLERFSDNRLIQATFGSILRSYGVKRLDTERMRQAYVSNRKRKHPTRHEISDADLRRAAIYFLIDPRWSSGKKDFMECLRRLRPKNTSR